MAGKSRPCVQCGVTFTPEFPRGAARTCSLECSKERKRANTREAMKTYFKRHRETMRERAREYSRTHREERKAKWLTWARKNREHHNATNRARYAKRKAES